MSANRKIVYSIDPTISQSSFEQVSNSIRTDLVKDRQLFKVKDIGELYPLLVNPLRPVDLISVATEELCKNGNDLFLTVATLQTLIKNTRYIDKFGRSAPRDVQIMLLVGDQIDRSLLREAMALEGVILGYKIGGTFTAEDIKDHCAAYDNGNYEIPKKIKELLKPKKKPKIVKEKTIELTPRQQQIYKLISTRGASNKVIARMLNISESTVKLHTSAILKKYGVRNRTQLAVFAKERDLEYA